MKAAPGVLREPRSRKKPSGQKFEHLLTKGSGIRLSILFGDYVARELSPRGGPAMAAALVPDIFWEVIEPLLPLPKPKPQGGRPRIPDRACFEGIVFVLRSGIPWEMLPKELGCGSGMTCWRRLRDWQESGLWQLIHFAVLDLLCRLNRIDWSRAVVDSCSVRAVFGGSRPVGIPLIGLSSVPSVI
jgi:transposase